MRGLVRLHKGLIASAVGLFVFLAGWSLLSGDRPFLAATSMAGALALTAYYVLVVRRKYG